LSQVCQNMLVFENMHILVYHPVVLPALQYGGTERVVMWVVNGLKRRGHRVSVFAAAGSSMPDGIDCITDPEVLKKRVREFDLVHSFSKLSTDFIAEFQGRVITTIQGNGQLGEKFDRNTVFVSRDHAERHGGTEFVYNGLDPDELSFSERARPNRFLFLSKTSWKVKNAAGAAKLAHHANQNIWIAGGERPYSLKLQCAMMKLFGKDWKWVGSVNQVQKSQFFVEGKAFVFPLLWNEPFGIVMTESLVSGTPVFAHPFGSVPEVLEFAPQCLMHSREEWKAAMTGQVKLPSARECRDWVLSKFHHDQMLDKYLSLYEKVLQGVPLNSVVPETKKLASDVNLGLWFSSGATA
jgi:glycosyltransferase involved in cell wall biosynthesis